MKTQIIAVIFSAGFAMPGTEIVSAQTYPHKPLRLIAPEPGEGVDFAARIVAQGISGSRGQPVIVENRGGGGNVSGEIVTKAARDGYTLLVTGSTF